MGSCQDLFNLIQAALCCSIIPGFTHAVAEYGLSDVMVAIVEQICIDHAFKLIYLIAQVTALPQVGCRHRVGAGLQEIGLRVQKDHRTIEVEPLVAGCGDITDVKIGLTKPRHNISGTNEPDTVNIL